MSKRESNQRQLLIIRRLQKAPATFVEIQDYLEYQSEFTGYRLTSSVRTFKRDCEEIESFHPFEIRFDFSSRKWVLKETVNESQSERLLEALEIFQAMRLTEGLSQQVYFEARKPAGTEYLYGLLHAIKSRLPVQFRYQKFWEDAITRRVRPFALKEFRNRWYLLAMEAQSDTLKTFGLDRMHDFEVLRTKFTGRIQVDVAALYQDAFGILNDEDYEPQDVVLWFEKVQAGYVRTTPLHHSQQIEKEDKNGLTIRLHVRLTHDFVMELLSYGPQVKVLQPATLVREVREAHKKALAQYEQKPG